MILFKKSSFQQRVSHKILDILLVVISMVKVKIVIKTTVQCFKMNRTFTEMSYQFTI